MTCTNKTMMTKISIRKKSSFVYIKERLKYHGQNLISKRQLSWSQTCVRNTELYFETIFFFGLWHFQIIRLSQPSLESYIAAVSLSTLSPIRTQPLSSHKFLLSFLPRDKLLIPHWTITPYWITRKLWYSCDNLTNNFK